MKPETRTRRHAFIAGFLAASTVAVFALVPATPANAITPDSAFENCLRDKHNAARKAAGVAPLETKSEMVSFARNHTADMIAAGNIYHSSDLTKATTGWTKLGENVGRGGSCDSLHDAFMNSSGHRQNLLDPVYTSIGVGGAQDADGRMYVTVVFAAHKNASTPTTTTAPAPTTTAAPKPKPTTTTTQPPTTTTTQPTTTTSLQPGTALPPFFDGPGGDRCGRFIPFQMASSCTDPRTDQYLERRALVM
jgi:cell division septation protein DedD